MRRGRIQDSPLLQQIVVNNCIKQYETVGANLMFALYVSLLRLQTQDRTEFQVRALPGLESMPLSGEEGQALCFPLTVVC